MKDFLSSQDSIETLVEDLLHVQGYVLQDLLGIKLSFERVESKGMDSPGDSYPMTLYNYVYPNAGEFFSYRKAISQLLGLNSSDSGTLEPAQITFNFWKTGDHPDYWMGVITNRWLVLESIFSNAVLYFRINPIFSLDSSTWYSVVVFRYQETLDRFKDILKSGQSMVIKPRKMWQTEYKQIQVSLQSIYPVSKTIDQLVKSEDIGITGFETRSHLVGDQKLELTFMVPSVSGFYKGIHLNWIFDLLIYYK